MIDSEQEHTNFSLEVIEKHSKKMKTKESERVKALYDILLSENLIRPGSVISAHVMEKSLGIKYKGNDDWRFLGPYLALKVRLESEGFFVTQRDITAPGFRILRTEEMERHALEKLMNNMVSNYNIACVMGNHDTSALSESEKKKFNFAKSKATQTAMIQHKMLLDRSSF